MNGYICFLKGKRIEVFAETSLKAQRKAAEIFKTKKSYEIATVLAQKPDGENVIHIPVD